MGLLDAISRRRRSPPTEAMDLLLHHLYPLHPPEESRPGIGFVLLYRPENNSITYWRKIVEEYFAPRARERWCVSSYENRGSSSAAASQRALIMSWEFCSRCHEEYITRKTIAPQVIHFELPNSSEIFVHRFGRTGRAGKKGTAIVMYNYRQNRDVQSIERDIGSKFQELPKVNVEGSDLLGGDFDSFGGGGGGYGGSNFGRSRCFGGRGGGFGNSSGIQ